MLVGSESRRRCIGILVLVCLWPVVTGCRSLLRTPLPKYSKPGDQVADLPDDAAEYLGAAVFSDLTVEIDWVEGCKPSDRAVAGLERLLARHLPQGMTWRVVRDSEIAREEWSALRGDSIADDLGAKYIGNVPDEGTGKTTIYVLYLPYERTAPAYLGYLRSWAIERDGVHRLLTGAVLFSESIKRQGFLWLTDSRIERNVLVHEIGHVLGLVENRAHAQDEAGHCTNAECVMNTLNWRTAAYWSLSGVLGIWLPRNFCKDCREDIRRAKNRWSREGEAALRSHWRSRQARAGAGKLWSQQRRKDAVELLEHALPGLTEPEDHQAVEVSLGGYFEELGYSDRAGKIYATAASRTGCEGKRRYAMWLNRRGAYGRGLEVLSESARPCTDRESVGATAWSMSGLGRFGDAAAALQAYDGSRDTSVEQMNLNLELLDLSVRADLPEKIQAQLSKIESRWGRSTRWLVASWQLAKRSGNAALAASYREQAVINARNRVRFFSQYKTTAPASYAVQLRKLASVQALRGEGEDARATLALWNESNEGAATSEWLEVARAYSVLGDLEEARNALLEIVGVHRPSDLWSDPCIIEEFDHFRDSAGLESFFAHCPPRAGE